MLVIGGCLTVTGTFNLFVPANEVIGALELIAAGVWLIGGLIPTEHDSRKKP
jgi:hypothetical protein